MLNRKIQPNYKTLSNINIITPQKNYLSNNTIVHTIDGCSQEVVKIDFIFKAGIWNQSKALQASFTNQMLYEGTTNRSSAKLAEEIDYMGAYIQCSCSHHDAVITILCLNRHLPKMLDLVYDIVNNSILPENEFITLLKNKEQDYIVNKEKVNFIAKKEFGKLIFGESHPYSGNLNATDFTKINHNDIVEFYKQFYKHNSMEIIAAGNIPNNIMDLLNERFTTTNCLHNNIKDYKIIDSIKQNQFIKKDGAIQTAIRVGRKIVNRTHKDFQGLKVLNTVLGGYFGSRLMNNIREDKGYTYGIGSVLSSMPNNAYFSIITEVGNEFKEQTLHEIYKEIKCLQTNIISDEELKVVKNFLVGDTLRKLDGSFSLSDIYKDILLYDLDFNYLNSTFKEIETITSKDLIELANKYLNKEDLLEIVVGG